jgi:hypothetical protein
MKVLFPFVRSSSFLWQIFSFVPNKLFHHMLKLQITEAKLYLDGKLTQWKLVPLCSSHYSSLRRVKVTRSPRLGELELEYQNTFHRIRYRSSDEFLLSRLYAVTRGKASGSSKCLTTSSDTINISTLTCDVVHSNEISLLA